MVIRSLVVRERGDVPGKLNIRFYCFFFFQFSEPPQIGAFSFSKSVMDEGDFAQLSCIVNRGDLPLSISWTFHGLKVGQETGITTTNLGPRMSILVINSVGYKHKGQYTCQAKNHAGVVTRSAELKVNGRLE